MSSQHVAAPVCVMLRGRESNLVVHSFCSQQHVTDMSGRETYVRVTGACAITYRVWLCNSLAYHALRCVQAA